MRVGSFATLVAAVLNMPAALASDVRIPTLPESVVGAWGPSEDACKGSAPGKIDITAKEHSSADASCQIAWITVTASRDSPVYSARSQCTQTKTGKKLEPSYLVVTPRPDNALLVRMPNANPDDQLTTYRKCS